MALTCWGGVALAQPAAPNGNAERVEWTRWSALKRQLAGQEVGDAGKVADAFAAHFAERELPAPVGIAVAMAATPLYERAAQTSPEAGDKLLALLNKALERYGKAPGSLSLYGAWMRALLLTGQKDEVRKWFEANWDAVLEGGGGDVLGILWPYISLLESDETLAAREKLIGVLTSALKRAPTSLDATAQGQPSAGWMYEKLVSALLAQGRDQEALGWAKLRFVTGAFTPAEAQATFAGCTLPSMARLTTSNAPPSKSKKPVRSVASKVRCVASVPAKNGSQPVRCSHSSLAASA